MAYPTPTTFTLSDLGLDNLQSVLTANFSGLTGGLSDPAPATPLTILEIPDLTFSISGSDADGTTGTSPTVAINQAQS
ncbi:MAG: hypothetical protein WDO13_20935 [Verrucomicrobiota bacterium]